MPAPSTRFICRSGAVLALGLLSLAFVAACGGGNDGGTTAGGTTPTAPPATMDMPRTEEASGEGGPLDLPMESGLGNIYWRTEDDFQSVVAGEPYKVVLRVTGGYNEDTLPIVAEHDGGGGMVEFSADRVMPVGDEDEGSFYTFELLLPEPGSWGVTMEADEERVTVSVEVGSAREPDTTY